MLSRYRADSAQPDIEIQRFQTSIPIASESISMILMGMTGSSCSIFPTILANDMTMNCRIDDCGLASRPGRRRRRFPPSARGRLPCSLTLIANIVIVLVALLHVYFLVLEMFLWDKPAGLRAFGQTLEAAKASKVLAANQGLYNGFLAAGLMWGLMLGPGGTNIKLFFLGCVLIAGGETCV